MIAFEISYNIDPLARDAQRYQLPFILAFDLRMLHFNVLSNFNRFERPTSARNINKSARLSATTSGRTTLEAHAGRC